MDFILFGIQGSGKGTQGKFLAEKYGMKIFEMGAELRNLAQEQSDLGKKVNDPPLSGAVKSIIEAGHLVPTEIIMEIIENFLSKSSSKQGIIFDGIPRSLEQAEAFDNLMQKLGREFVGIYFELSKEEAIKRLATRRICESCKEVYPAVYKENSCSKCGGKLITRADDNIASIENRINAYDKETLPIIKNYKEKGLIIEVDAKPSIEKITELMLEKVEMFLVKSS